MLFEVLSLFFLCGWRTRPQNSTEKKCYSFRVLCLRSKKIKIICFKIVSNLKKNKRKSHLNSSQPFKLNVKKHVLTTCFKSFEEEGKKHMYLLSR